MFLAVSNDNLPTLRDFAAWNFQPSGDYAVDCKTGASLARTFVAMIADEGEDCPPVLQQTVSAIAQRGGELSGLEVAFFAYLQKSITHTDSAIGRRTALTLCR